MITVCFLEYIILITKMKPNKYLIPHLIFIKSSRKAFNSIMKNLKVLTEVEI